jgi:serine/threonine protein kinase
VPAAAQAAAYKASLPDFIDFSGHLLDVDKVYSVQLKGKRVQLLTLIGIGSCCTVYKGLLVARSGRAVPPDKQVLQQTTDKELWLLTEMAQPVGESPFIVQLYRTGVLHVGDSSSSSNGKYRLAVLELLGKSLESNLTATGPAHPKMIRIVMWQLLHALNMLHNNPSYRVVHRDLKPANIMLVPSMRPGQLGVKLVDLTSCAVIDRAQPASGSEGSRLGSSMTNSSDSSQDSLQCSVTDSLPLRGLFGTPFYMAPEVAALFDTDEAAAALLPGYSEKVDVYALGAIAVTMAAGGGRRLQEHKVVPPGVRQSEHLAGLISRFASGQLLVRGMTADNMQAYEGLRQFVGVCCAHDPAQRPSIADLKRRNIGPAWLHELS